MVKDFFIVMSNNCIMNMDEFRKLFYGLKNGKYHITLKDARQRSIPQNRYYRGVVVPLVRKGLYDAGYDEVKTNDDAHEVMKGLFHKKDIVNKLTGDMITTVLSTTTFSIPEFDNFIETICKWAAEFLGVVIPAPNQVFVEYIDWVDTIMEDETKD